MRTIVSIDTQRPIGVRIRGETRSTAGDPRRRFAMAGQGEPIFVKAAEAVVVRVSRHGEGVVVAVVGEIDAATAPILEEAIDVAAKIDPRVIANLFEASYVDSSTLNALIHAQCRLSDQEFSLIVVKPANPNVAKLFGLTRLPADLALVESLEHALSRLDA